jgi:uncharacterized membrane protein
MKLQRLRRSKLTEQEVLTELKEEQLSLGQRIADKVAEFGGSWGFIISFFGFILIWIAVNAVLFVNKGFDPYPYILLNLILSCLAAIQAPIIMMSQNRMEEKDRARSIRDYQVNVEAEVEIREILGKLDLLIAQHAEFRKEYQHLSKRLSEIEDDTKKQ